MSTPLRSLGTRTDEGWVMVRDVASEYRDGGEDRVFEILADATDLSSTSDELVSSAQNWAEHYHLSPMRANLLRPLALPADAVVLEIGAGCGAVTRYLGETCAVVDALEPVPSRAKALRARTRDQENVEVFVGEVADVPAEPTYDLVVVVGVLEYVGHGSADPAPYREFLDAIAARLRPGGSLVLAIENKLGAKYFAGSAEDHTHRHFDGIEGYPTPGPARTFSRRELVDLLAGSGLTADTVAAFPDYKLTRTLMAPQVLTGAGESLLYRIPSFPSPDWVVPREAVADERLLWRSLVQGGLAADTANSFVALAGKGAPSALWPQNQGAVFYSRDRRAVYSTETTVVLDGDTVRLDRVRVRPDPWPGDLSVRTGTAAFVPGNDLLDLFVDTDDEQSRDWLLEWQLLLEDLPAGEAIPLDLVPHNLVVDPDGALVAIDDEWRQDGVTVPQVLRRGALLMAVNLALRGRVRPAWVGADSFRDVALRIGEAVGQTDEGWLDDAVRDEARLQSSISVIPVYLQQNPDREQDSRTALQNLLSTRLDSQLSFGQQQAGAPDARIDHRIHGETMDSLRHQLHEIRTEAGVLFEERRDLGAELATHQHLLAQAQHRSEVEYSNVVRLAEELAAEQVLLAAARTELSELRDQWARSAATTSVLRSETERFRADVRTLSGRVAEVQGELDRTRDTVSWRVTAPLRWSAAADADRSCSHPADAPHRRCVYGP